MWIYTIHWNGPPNEVVNSNSELFWRTTRTNTDRKSPSCPSKLAETIEIIKWYTNSCRPAVCWKCTQWSILLLLLLRLQILILISLVQRRLRGQLIEVFKYLNRFTNASARGLFDDDLNDRTRNNRPKLIVKHVNTSVAQHFYIIKITTWNAQPNEVVSSRTVNSLNNSLDKHWEENLPNVRVNW